MWLFTKYGLFSAVSARQGDGRHREPIDPDRIMVRARVREHLEALRIRFPDFLGSCEILESRDADYAFRTFVDKRVWVQLVSELGLEINYDNFKSEVARQQGLAGTAYQHALHEVWATMLDLQQSCSETV